MDLQLLYHPQFSKDVKRLSKKYKSLVSDLKSIASMRIQIRLAFQ